MFKLRLCQTFAHSVVVERFRFSSGGNAEAYKLVAIMHSAASASTYSHPRLIQLIQEPQPEHDAAVRAVHAAEALVQDMQQALVQAEQPEQRYSRSQATTVRDMQHALMQAEQQLAQAQAQLQQTIPAQQEHRQLVQELQAMQCACWNRSLSAELSGLILGKTSRYNARMVAVSCPLLRDTINAAEPIKFETSPWSRMRIAAGVGHTLCVSARGRAGVCLRGARMVVAGWGSGTQRTEWCQRWSLDC